MADKTVEPEISPSPYLVVITKGSDRAKNFGLGGQIMVFINQFR